jgi:acyl-coenzyme A thioesterase PaaI-like protein
VTNRELEHELAAELRGLLLQLHRSASDEATLRAAIDEIRRMRAGLGTERRPRWFDAIGTDGHAHLHDVGFNDRSLFRGRSNALSSGLRVAVVDLADGRRGVEARVTCNQLYEGPPHGVHGGYVAGLFDDVLGSTIRLAGGPSAVTGTLQVKYRKVTPLDTELHFVAWVDHTSGRRILSRATCHANGVLTAEAEALFIRVDMRALAEQKADYRPPAQAE